MGYGQKVKKWFFEEEDGEDDVYEDVEIDAVEEEPAKTTSMFEKAKSTKTSDAVKALSANKDSHLVLFEPRAYSETQEIAIYLKQKRAAVVNLHRLQKEQSKRVIDFLSGVIFAIEGDIQQIGPKIFLCTPKNIGVSGNITMDAPEGEE
ncbi:MAG: cell division protein SepF [Coprobacillus sp.]